MRQTVVELLKIASEWVMLTFTELSREKDGFKTTPSSRTVGDTGKGAAEVDGKDVTGVTVVTKEIADVAGGGPAADVSAGEPA